MPEHQPASASAAISPLPSTALIEALSILDLIRTAEHMTSNARSETAAQLYRDWIAHHDHSPALYIAYFNLGVLLVGLDDHAGAEPAYRSALALVPSLHQARLNLGTVLERMGRFDEALTQWRVVLDSPVPESSEDKALQIHALNNLGRLLEIRKDDAAAEAMLTRSLALDPQQPEVIAHWVHLRQKLCMWPAFAPFAGASYEDLLHAGSALALLAESDDPAVQLAASQRYVEKKVLPLQIALAPADGYDHPRLRIGYLSSDFCNHAVSILTAELYALHDRSKVEVFGFSWSREDGSPLRARVVGAMDHYIRIDAMTDEEAARCIQSHEIDILVDLHGLTLGARHDILSWRPAPVQLTYLGFPGPTALPAIDYVVADRFLLPPELQLWFTEKALYLPDCFQVNDRQRTIGPRLTRTDYGLPEDAFVFCSFNSTFKIKPDMFTAWMEILRRTDDSVLWLVADGDAVQLNLREQARAQGVDPQRLVFAGRVAPEHYLARYQVADLFLDTAPFGGGTTASDALWAGLPLLTCAGRSFSSRMAGSLLHAIDLPELVTHELSSYIALAVDLAKDRPRLNTLQRRLEEERMRSALFDSPRTVRALEQKFFEIAKRPNKPQPLPMPDEKVSLFQIAWSDEVMAHIEPGYGVLDNRHDYRHDWREYWPIRKFLLTQQLDEDRFYGFFSPKFAGKTGLSHRAVLDFIAAAPLGTDVFTFSPQPDMGSFFLNVFEQNELFDPGFIAASEAFLEAVGQPLPLATLVMDSRQVVFSNFIVAKPAFWRAWLALNEKLFAICEGPDSLLKTMLTHATTYPGQVERKVFLVERIASLLLTIDAGWRVKAYDTFQCAWSASKLADQRMEAVLSDALKIAMREQGFAEYTEAFAHVRERLRR